MTEEHHRSDRLARRIPRCVRAAFAPRGDAGAREIVLSTRPSPTGRSTSAPSIESLAGWIDSRPQA